MNSIVQSICLSMFVWPGAWLTRVTWRSQYGRPGGQDKIALRGARFWLVSSKRCKIGTWLLWNANRSSYALYRMALFPVT